MRPNIKDLLSARQREALGVFVVEGPKLAREIPDGWEILLYALREGEPDPVWLRPGVPVARAGAAKFARLASAAAPQGVLAVARMRRLSIGDMERAGGPGFALALDGVSDPGNVGGLLRTAAAAGAGCALLAGGCAGLYNPKTLRAAAGAALSLPVADGLGLARALDFARGGGMPVFAAGARGGAPPWELDLSGRFCLVLGNESRGLSALAEAAADRVVTLPMGGRAESLGVAAAGAAIMYEAARQRASAGRGP